jgi:hypothetical protein
LNLILINYDGVVIVRCGSKADRGYDAQAGSGHEGG